VQIIRISEASNLGCLEYMDYQRRDLGFDLPFALDFPLGFPLGFGLRFRFRGALASPYNEIFIA